MVFDPFRPGGLCCYLWARISRLWLKTYSVMKLPGMTGANILFNVSDTCPRSPEPKSLCATISKAVNIFAPLSRCGGDRFPGGQAFGKRQALGGVLAVPKRLLSVPPETVSLECFPGCFRGLAVKRDFDTVKIGVDAVCCFHVFCSFHIALVGRSLALYGAVRPLLIPPGRARSPALHLFSLAVNRPLNGLKVLYAAFLT